MTHSISASMAVAVSMACFLVLFAVVRAADTGGAADPRAASLNRAQTVLEEDGSFRMILAHENPGLPNWLDTEGNLFGLVFWRFFLAQGEVETPRATVVKLADLGARD